MPGAGVRPGCSSFWPSAQRTRPASWPNQLRLNLLGMQVRGMAAATLKSIAVWVEGQVQGPGPCQALVQQVLGQLVQESNPRLGKLSQQGPSLEDDEPWNDSLLPTQHSMLGSGITGQPRRLYQASIMQCLTTCLMLLPLAKLKMPPWSLRSSCLVTSIQSPLGQTC